MTNNVLELLISGGTVDLDSNFKIQLNYAVSQIQDISKKNSNFSKQFRISNTKNNHLLFKSVFEIANDSEFNPNKKVDAQLLNNTLPIFTGYLQLKKINHDLKNEIDYEFVFYAGTANLISAINGYYLSDIDLSAYDHQYDHTNITGSWYNTWERAFTYPMVDYGFGYTMQTINQQNQYSIDYKNYTPALFIKRIWNSIFDFAGFTYNSDSDFFNSDRFEKLILLGSPKLLEASLQKYYKDNLYFRAGEYINNIIINPGLPQTQIPIYFLGLTGAANWTGDRYTATEFGKYKFHFKIFAPTQIFQNYKLILKLNGFQVWNSALVNLGVSNFVEEFSTSWIDLAPGDVLSQEIFLINNNGGNVNVTFVPGCQIEMEAVYGQKYYLNECFNKTSLTEIIKSIISMFNLFIEQDPQNERNYLITTRDKYYKNGRIIDWTNKLDTSTPLEEEILSELQNKNFLFSYQDDNDYFNSTYKNTTNKVYAQELIEVDNDFLKSDSTTLIQPSFAATPLVSLQGSQQIIIPKIYNVSSEGELEKFNFKNRILYFQGALPCESYYILSSGNTTPSGSANFQFQDTYGASGHFDNNQNPTFDLNFGLPDFTYINQINSYSAITGTTGFIYPADNLYNSYWENTVNEITDKNARLITAKFYLKPSDINNLRFSDSIFVKDIYYKLNKVAYNPLEDETATVELIKSINNIVEGRYKKKGTVIVHDDKNSLRINLGYNNEVLHPGNITVGRYNNIDDHSTGNFVLGNSNDLKGTKDSHVSGLYNQLQGDQSSIVGGSGNTILVNANASIIQARDSKISGLTNANSIIITGKQNEIIRSQYSSIIGGDTSKINDSLHSWVIQSTQSTINNSTRNSIFGGYGNYSYGRLNSILNSAYSTNKGVKNFIANSYGSSALGNNGTIISANGSRITGNFSFILGGKYNYVNSNYSLSIGGKGYNVIETATSNVILLGVDHCYAVYPNTTVTQGKQVLDLAGTGDRLVYAQADGLLKTGISISAITSGGTIIISGGSVSGLTSILNTGSTHGILLKQQNNIAYLKSLSGVAPNIFITSSSTENAIALSNNVYINSLTATTSIYSGNSNLNAIYSHTGHTHPLSDLLNGNLGDTIRHTGGTRGWVANNFLYNPGNKIGINATNINSMFGMRATGASINEMLLQVRSTGNTTTAQSTYELLRLNANGLLTVGQSLTNWAGVPTQPDILQYNYGELFTTAHTVSTLLVTEERALGTTTGSNVVMMVDGQSGNEGINNTALWVRANLIGNTTNSNNNVLVLEDTNYFAVNNNYNSSLLKVIGGQFGIARTGMTISRGLLTAFGTGVVDSFSEVYITAKNRGAEYQWNLLKLASSAGTEVFSVKANGNITALTLSGTGTNNLVVSNSSGLLSSLTLTGNANQNVVVSNAAGAISVVSLTGASSNFVVSNAFGQLSTIPYTGASSAFTISNVTNNNNTYNITGSTSLTALTVGNLTVTGTSVFNSLTATTYYSGSTPLNNIFSNTGHTHSLSQILNTAHTHSISEINNLSAVLNTKFDLSASTSAFTSSYESIPFSHAVMAAPADLTTYYCGSFPSLTPSASVALNRRIYPVFSGTITSINFFIYITNTGSSENNTFNIRLNNTTDYLITNTAKFNSNPLVFSNFNMNVPIANPGTDFIEIKWDTPNWSINPSTVYVSGTIGFRY